LPKETAVSVKVIILRVAKKLPQTDTQFYEYGTSIWSDNDTAIVPTTKDLEKAITKMQKQIDTLKNQVAKLRNKPGARRLPSGKP
jgi:hypothetical protein